MSCFCLSEGTFYRAFPMHRKGEGQHVVLFQVWSDMTGNETMPVFFEYFEVFAVQDRRIGARVRFCRNVVHAQLRKINHLQTTDNSLFFHHSVYS